ncbi:MAG: phosphate ABC transporter permease subunit PstC [Candidatus Edwardsbacteria bacterium RIFOXYD12_FULL_50_11]|uniref:Phosphate transport system permease protein n=1 Tax=Candidatus Edwardsbacteria bacterium GWF2_54_11 TaxID=1817851 RepID=A0A1F5RI22_9BACT|nr:MAG: phosphate ABC transporter permease subunit PstC [Candidatus Edwardsbacteria bacterium RifOxyC12_full_54_24]OGF07063.1 MAG: phosphate ABC transporter permease subunit PstC [Candidatus Edwardsbacteria bacterium RifOxyA12_full_54_48]OGF10972.1 MAG: phosphate ABC transporter permease subunit PstC [Candidatus Edwardsbacteria bacterium GWE2_54_12]OGF14125.1 MAG: phosphate ABC transporter permease subunit PstC [Candidatus Edwardsbacteria bacterium GWF2_54_11]OGF15917.1 MAG: phosphate ABC trans
MSLKKRRFKYLTESLIEGNIKITATFAIVVVFLIFIFIMRESLPIFFNSEVQQEITFGQFFNSIAWRPVSDNPRFSLWPIILGSLKVTLIALFFAVPVAIAAALYSSEFAGRRLKEFIKPTVELLAGIPSVVLGFFALMVMASFLKNIFGWEIRLNAVNAGIALGFAVIPSIYSLAEDAINAVPRSFREAALGLGASPWQTALKVVLPAALPGVSAAVLFGMGRAVGETMVVLMAAGNAPLFSFNPLNSTRTMTATIAAELGEVVFGSGHYHALFFIGLVLFLVTFVINMTSWALFDGLMSKLYGAKK